MTQNKNLKLLIAEVTDEQIARGNSPNTIARHQRVYLQLLDFAQRNNSEEYSGELISRFLEERNGFAQNHSPRYMEQYSIALNKLSDKASGKEMKLYHRHYPASAKLECFSWVLHEMEAKLELRLKDRNDINCRIHELRLFLTYLETEGIDSLASIDINHLAVAFQNAGDKGRFHSIICEFLSVAHKNGWMPLDLSCFVPKVRAHKPFPAVYRADEVERVLSSIDASTDSGKRKRAVFLIVARLGLRNSDVCELKFSNLDWGKKMISLIQKKTGVPISLPLLPEIEDAITAYLTVRPQSNLPFIFLRNRAPYLPLRNTTVIYELRKLFKDSGINTLGKQCSPRTLRSSLASSLLEDGVSYPIIQKTLGHSSPSATKYYAKVDVAKLRDCALEVPPPSGNFARLIGGSQDA